MMISPTKVLLFKDGGVIAGLKSSLLTAVDKVNLPWGGTGNGMYVNYITLMSAATIACNNMPDRSMLRVGGITTFAVSGVAVLDVSTLTFPQSNVEILDEFGSVISAISLNNDVWGGDVYVYTSAV